jgi:hypothetical protein
MRSQRKQRSAGSEAVFALRNAMGKTQQTFAVEVLNIAISTIGRWETWDPPKGDALLRLAEIADTNGHREIRDRFRELYLDDVLPRLGFNIIVNPDPEPHGYSVVRLQGRHQIELAQKFLRELAGEPDTSPMAQIQNAVLPGVRHGK